MSAPAQEHNQQTNTVPLSSLLALPICSDSMTTQSDDHAPTSGSALIDASVNADDGQSFDGHGLAQASVADGNDNAHAEINSVGQVGDIGLLDQVTQHDGSNGGNGDSLVNVEVGPDSSDDSGTVDISANFASFARGFVDAESSQNAEASADTDDGQLVSVSLDSSNDASAGANSQSGADDAHSSSSGDDLLAATIGGFGLDGITSADGSGQGDHACSDGTDFSAVSPTALLGDLDLPTCLV